MSADDVKIKIVVVDDMISTLMLHCIMLDRAGYETVQCRSGNSALNALKEDEYDLLVTDLDMSPMDGIGLIQRVRSNLYVSNMPILLTAKLSDAALVKAAIDEGAGDFIFTPVDHHQLIAKVRDMLRTPTVY